MGEQQIVPAIMRGDAEESGKIDPQVLFLFRYRFPYRILGFAFGH
ncbi:MAG: hypothetical protein VYE18_10135 [Pseudomonadota bacterium]|nr:hypothetical protein [Pseudomonadota bacterium]